MRTLLMTMLPLMFLTGCPSDEESAESADMGVEQSGVCAEVDCGANGRCVEVDLLPTCECDSGFTANGLTCVAGPLTDAPAGFRCDAVSVEGPHLQALTGGAFALVENDRACGVSDRTVFEFRANGVFVFREQDDGAAPGAGGTVLYGCWSVTEARDDRVLIAYDYGVETGRNCGWLGDLEDPACAAELAYLEAEDAMWEIADEEQNQERFVHRRVDPALDCTFCGDDAGCCPSASWVSDRDGELGCD